MIKVMQMLDASELKIIRPLTLTVWHQRVENLQTFMSLRPFAEHPEQHFSQAVIQTELECSERQDQNQGTALIQMRC